MNLRELGRSGIRVPTITFGGNVFGWTVDQATSFSLLDALLDHQLNFIDTATFTLRGCRGISAVSLKLLSVTGCKKAASVTKLFWLPRWVNRWARS